MKPLKISGQAPKASSPTCPNCGEVLHAQAIVEAFNEPSNWTFYGEQGKRWKRCTGSTDKADYVHFVVEANRKMTHRVAWYNVRQSAN